jgi:hypothetical protein
MGVANSTPRPLENLERHPISLNNELGGLQCRCGRLGGKKNVLFMERVEPRTLQPASKSLYRLSYTRYDSKKERTLLSKVITKLRLDPASQKIVSLAITKY